MLEGLQARIFLAKSRVLKTIDPELANELGLAAINEAYCIGMRNHDMQLGQLIIDEPDLVDSFHEGADLGSKFHSPRIDLNPRYLACE
jgi:hypothetical protein